MSKRKLATKSKHSRSPKIAAKPQRAAQAVIKSPKDIRLAPIGAVSTVALPKRHDEQEALAGDPTTGLQQEARLEPATALQDRLNNHLTEGFGFSLATASVRAFQAKLLEVAQANMRFAFEFAQRLATMKSPGEFLSVAAEFTSKRTAMFLMHSKEMAEFIAPRNKP